MKHIKICLLALLGLLLVPQISRAQAAAASTTPAAATTLGKVSAYIVTGDVELINSADKTSRPLKRGDQFTEGNLVKAMPGGGALLVFSNGSTMKITENTQVEVTSYKQEAFDEKTQGTFLRLDKDPSKSTTELDLRNGTLQGEVKQINTNAGSKFTVNTPGGSAGIRGTILSITVIRNAAGQVTGIIATCMVGNVTFTPSPAVTVTGANGAKVTTVGNVNPDLNVGTGNQIQMALTVDPTTGKVTGGGVVGANLGANATNDLIAALNETVNTAKTLTGQNITPPQTVQPSQLQATVTVNTGNGNTVSASSTVNAITVVTPTTAQPTITQTDSATSGGVTVTVTGTVSAPVNTNPSNVSAD
jgi:hypothetical protein